MEQSKWKIEETEDDNVLLTNGKITMATSNVEDEYLRAILVLLNNSGGDFHSENELERDLGVQLHIASYELEQYKARCDRYEKALKEIENVHAYPNVVARKALSGEGEKEKQWWEKSELPKYVKHKHGWVGEHIGMNHAGDCLVFIGRNDTIEWQFSFLQPATKEEYEAFINQKEDKQ